MLLGHLARRPPGRVRRAARATRSGSAPRPTPSSRAAPTAPTRSSASWSAPRSSGPRAASRTSSSSTSAERAARWTRRATRRRGFASLGRDAVWRGRRVSMDRGRFLDPDGEAFEREVVRHPGAVGGARRRRRGAGHPGPPVPAPPLGRVVLEMPAGHPRRRGGAGRADRPGASSPRRPGWQAGALERLAAVYNSPGLTRPASPPSSSPPGSRPCATDRERPRGARR